MHFFRNFICIPLLPQGFQTELPLQHLLIKLCYQSSVKFCHVRSSWSELFCAVGWIPALGQRSPTRANGSWKFFFKQKKHIFYSEGDQTQKEVAQRGCGISILGGIQNLTGHYPRPLAPADCAWAGGLDKTISMGAFPPQQAFDSVILMAWLLCSLAFIASFVSPSVSFVHLHSLDNTGSERSCCIRKGRRDEPTCPAVFLPSALQKCLSSIFSLEDSWCFLNRNVTHDFLTGEQKDVKNPTSTCFSRC